MCKALQLKPDSVENPECDVDLKGRHDEDLEQWRD